MSSSTKLQTFIKTPKYHVGMICLMMLDIYFKPFGNVFVFLDTIFIGYNLYPLVELGTNKLNLYVENHRKVA